MRYKSKYFNNNFDNPFFDKCLNHPGEQHPKECICKGSSRIRNDRTCFAVDIEEKDGN